MVEGTFNFLPVATNSKLTLFSWSNKEDMTIRIELCGITQKERGKIIKQLAEDLDRTAAEIRERADEIC